MIFGLEFKSNLGKALAWLLVIVVIMGLLMAFFPLMQENNILSLVEGFREGFSEKTRHILGLSESIDFQDLTDYVPFIYQYLGLLFGIFATQLGARSLSKEQSAGTIEYLYSQPVTRSQILTGKILANLVLYAIVIFITLVATFGFSYIFGAESLNFAEMSMLLGQIFLFLFIIGFVFLCIGYCYSALSNRVSHADGGSLLILLLLLIVWIIFVLIGQEFVQLFPFEALNPMIGLKEGLEIIGLALNLGIGILLLILSYIIYNAKELKF